MDDTRVVRAELHTSSPPINLEVMAPRAEAEAQAAAGTRDDTLEPSVLVKFLPLPRSLSARVTASQRIKLKGS